MRYFLGIDVGNSKSHALIVNETGHTAGYGEAGCGSPEVLGVDAMGEVLQGITAQALEMAGLNVDQVAGAGFGIDQPACEYRHSFSTCAIEQDSHQGGNSHLISIWTARL